jgi:molybdate transport system substrate-binding protein
MPGIPAAAAVGRVALAVVLTCALGTGGCGDDDGAGSASGSITVLAAASLTDAFTEIGAAFEDAVPGTRVTFGFAGSSALARQVVEGAPADVLASADTVTMDMVQAADGIAGAPVVFATNRLTMAVEPGNPLGIRTLADLAAPDVALVVCAEQVPCGRAAAEALDAAGVEVRPRSLEENVRAVLAKVALGEADAGLVFVTDVAASDGSVDGVAIGEEAEVVVRSPIAVTRGSRAASTAQAFVDFVTGPRGQQILAAHGFGAP